MSILKYQENTFTVMKPAIKTQYIWMNEVGLDLHLPPQLMVNTVFVDLFLE